MRRGAVGMPLDWETLGPWLGTGGLGRVPVKCRPLVLKILLVFRRPLEPLTLTLPGGLDEMLEWLGEIKSPASRKFLSQVLPLCEPVVRVEFVGGMLVVNRLPWPEFPELGDFPAPESLRF